MQRLRGPFIVLLVRLGAVALVYSLLRVLFVLLNKGSFPDVPLATYISGIRFDVSAIMWINMAWAALCLIHSTETGWYAKLKEGLFHVGNVITLFFACVDLEYYKFTLKRSTVDLLGIMSGGGDMMNLVPGFLRDFWYVAVIFALCVVFLVLAYRRAARLRNTAPLPIWRSLLWRAVAIFLVVIGSRGGSQLIPLGVIHASDGSTPRNIPVVLNTPFTLLMSLGKPVLVELTYMSQADADRNWPVVHHYTAPDSASHRNGDPPNVVVIILESFSSVYSARLGGGVGYMPFLDSLMGEGLDFSRAYANGRRSVDGVPAILASIPELMDEAFIQSPYAQSRFTSLASVLLNEGYSTSFFHGGRNGTMGFDGFARSAGFQRYVGLNEYPDPADHDGTWGIRDKPFLQFFAKEMSKEKEPFLGAIFTLSSHHPYELPPEDAKRFAGGTHRIHPALRYSDEALRAFFTTAKEQPWFDRTLFVVTADHTADIDRTGQDYSASVDYWIPLVYYMPALVRPGSTDRVTEQIDILPTVLDLIGYDKPFFSFGSSAVRRERQPLAITRIMGGYMAMHAGGVLHFFEGRQPDASALRDSTTATICAAVQQFNHRMRTNQLTVE